jgi:hypothetical protein
MPVFMIERRYAERIEAGPEMAAEINRINDDEGVRWLSSFLSADKRKTFCLYESPNIEAISERPSGRGCPPTWSSSSRGGSSTMARSRRSRSAANESWSQGSTMPCSAAYIAAVVRFGASSFMRMLRTWFAAVF